MMNGKRWIWGCLRFAAACWIIPLYMGDSSQAAQAAQAKKPPIPLQELVDRARPGEVVRLKAGDYAGPVVIGKKLVLQGEDGTLLVHDSRGPAITVKAEGVEIRGLAIRQKTEGEGSAAVLVRADKAVLRELDIRTRGSGILLREASGGRIEDNVITWDRVGARLSLGQKGNGIDLYGSPDNRMTRNEIRNMKDGIYLENSRSLTIENNRIYGSRYGIHCMYIDGTWIVGNRGESNFTGAMVMGVKDIVLSDNVFTKQSKNVHAQGILLYDVRTSLVERNRVDGNRVGIYLERSSDNELRDNAVYRNFIGIQFADAERNRIHGNDFVANVIEAEAAQSGENRIERNYWDSFEGLDLNGDGFSETEYAMNPFYKNLISRTPAFQLFFQSPGMTFLCDMVEEDRKRWARDASPSMHLLHPDLDPALERDQDPIAEQRERIPEKTFMLIIASMLFAGSLVVIIYSRGAKS